MGGRYRLYSSNTGSSLFGIFSGGLYYWNQAGITLAGSQVAVIWTIVELVVVAGGFGDGYLLKKKRSRHPATIPVVSASTSVDNRQKLFLEIARLDDEFEAGKIPEEEYHKLRSAEKTQLVELMRRRKVGSDGG